jgi:hypothetical protein
MLRHQYTNYDDDQSTERFIAACQSIAATYDWLATECARQIAWRLKRDSIAAERSICPEARESFNMGVGGAATTLM